MKVGQSNEAGRALVSGERPKNGVTDMSVKGVSTSIAGKEVY